MSALQPAVVPHWAGDEALRYREQLRASTAAIRRIARRPRILVLEDEYLEAIAFAEMLKGLAHVIIQTDPRAALSLFLDQGTAGIRVDAAVVDIAMPHMSGIEFVQKLSSLPDRCMPVVFLSGYRRPAGDLPGEFLRKPTSREELWAALRKAAPKLLNGKAAGG